MKIKMVLLSLLSIFIVGISWLMNFGFIRFLLMFLPVPHAMLVFAIGIMATVYSSYKKIRLYNILFCLTYILCNVSFPDSGASSNFVFFGLFENDLILKLGGAISVIALVAHIVFLILQIVEIIRANRKESLT